MSADSASRVKGQRAVLVGAPSPRPATRIAVGILVAFAYVGTLAVAGFFISSAVNSKGDRGPVARATIADMPETPRIAAMPAPAPAPTPTPENAIVSPAPAPAPESPRAASPAAPVPAVESAPISAAEAAAPLDTTPIAAPATANVEAQQDEAPLAAIVSAPPVEAQPAVPPPPEQQEAALPASVAPPQAATPPPPSAAALDFARRGDVHLAQGDVANARLYYERAAELGDARAAHLLGNSFDPAFLERWGVRGMRGDPAEAARWYRRAGVLGASDAERDLAALPQ